MLKHRSGIILGDKKAVELCRLSELLDTIIIPYHREKCFLRVHKFTMSGIIVIEGAKIVRALRCERKTVILSIDA